MDNFENLKKHITELAGILNQFKSEAVQLRILDLVLDDQYPEKTKTKRVDENIRKPVRRRPKVRKTIGVPDTSSKSKKAPSGAGAVAALTQLTQGSFFAEPRTINDVIEHCKHNLARTFKANEFSGKLGRLVRDGVLTRKKNSDNQYEYKKA